MNETTICGTVTHVLSWLPDHLAPHGEGFWELRTASDHETGEPPIADFDLARDAHTAVLGAHVSKTLGVMVTLEATSQDIRRHRFWGRWSTEPAWLVRPRAAA